MGPGLGTGSGLGSLIPVAMLIVAMVTMLRNRRARRNARPDTDPADQDRRASAAELERRMASYLAQRNTDGGHHSAASTPNGRENER